jgi:geranylgeranyl diphosphate synthase type II
VNAARQLHGEYPDHLREEVERYLAALSFSKVAATGGLEEAMRYSLLAGGKRIRPVLCLATGLALGWEPARLLPLAAALELIHTYSLIHDDLPAMDDDDLRRGRPTCHRVFGEDVAILAGDALYAEAFHHLLGNQEGERGRLLEAAAELAAATGVNGMVGGQFLDIKGEGASGAEGLQLVHRLKTGRLIAASVECVLLLAGAGDRVKMTLGRFAAEIGLLFQIVDDILDVTGNEADLGKPKGSDERSGRITYVTLHGVEGARELAARSFGRATGLLAEAAGELVKEGGREPAELAQITNFIYRRTS